MQSFICTLCGRVFFRQTGFTRHLHSTHADLYSNSSNLLASDGLDYKLADDIPQSEDDILSQPPETVVLPNAGTPMDDTIQVHSFEDDDRDPLALFATPQKWQLCRSSVDTNLGKTKLNNIVKWSLIVPNANAKHHDQLYQLIADMEEMEGLVCVREVSSVNNERIATPFWYQNSIAAVRYNLGHPPLQDQLSYAPVKQMDSSGEHIYTEIWTANWWWKTQANFLLSPERLFLIRFSLCLGELECQRDHVREFMSERSCHRDRVRERVSECVREHLRECFRECIREGVRERSRERQSHIVRESRWESVAEIVCQLHRVRAGCVSRVSTPVLTRCV